MGVIAKNTMVPGMVTLVGCKYALFETIIINNYALDSHHYASNNIFFLFFNGTTSGIVSLF